MVTPKWVTADEFRKKDDNEAKSNVRREKMNCDISSNKPCILIWKSILERRVLIGGGRLFYFWYEKQLKIATAKWFYA